MSICNSNTISSGTDLHGEDSKLQACETGGICMYMKGGVGGLLYHDNPKGQC